MYKRGGKKKKKKTAVVLFISSLTFKVLQEISLDILKQDAMVKVII